METLKLKDDEKGINVAADILKKGGIVAIPTETVYGLAASAYDNEAIKKVFVAKGRPQDNPLIVHIADIGDIDNIVSEFPKTAKLLAKRFWPGPLTMVLPKSEKIAESVSGGLDTVAVRMPENEVARSIIRESGLPLAAPSANISGSPSPTKYEDVVADLDGKIDAVVCSGHCTVGVESTVITLAANPPRLLRPGKVTAEELREVIPDLVIDKAVLSGLHGDEKAASPGMKYKHYSPKTEVFLVEAASDDFCEFVNAKENSAAICFSEDADKIKRPTLSIGAENDEAEQARMIFEKLRESDILGVKTVYVHAPKKSGIGLAVYNRLIRAAGFKVIKPKLIIGLTGPTGAGKTTACEIAEKNGFKVINCDKTARRATEDKTCLVALKTAFGEDIINPDGSLNRAALAKKAFSSSENTELLNKT
ncbi:MAG: threonylcarbamoyl-AMP synthase, partial [Clostridia bacterium]|nr:threonylcarbamoyl-AMP synthase [Clostridia bacterium]